jgi:hypothetical protein
MVSTNDQAVIAFDHNGIGQPVPDGHIHPVRDLFHALFENLAVFDQAFIRPHRDRWVRFFRRARVFEQEKCRTGQNDDYQGDPDFLGHGRSSLFTVAGLAREWADSLYAIHYIIVNAGIYKLSQKRNMVQGQGRSKKATGGIYEIF